MPARLRNVLLFALLALVVIVFLPHLHHHDDDERGNETEGTVAVGGAENSSASDLSTLAVSAQPAAVAPLCAGQSLELALEAARGTLCLGAAHSIQNGSVRAYQMDTLVGPARSLRIEASGTLVVSASLSGDSASRLTCTELDCKGISISKRNADGVRTITLKNVRLTGVADETAILNGSVQTPADEPSALSCRDEGVSMIATDGSTMSFCAKGGAGFEIGNDGATTYRFTNLDNESLLVVIDPTQHVRRVEFDGERSLACQENQCRQIQISAPNSAGERAFIFSGTSLIDTRNGESNVVLNGLLVVPPL